MTENDEHAAIDAFTMKVQDSIKAALLAKGLDRLDLSAALGYRENEIDTMLDSKWPAVSMSIAQIAIIFHAIDRYPGLASPGIRLCPGMDGKDLVDLAIPVLDTAAGSPGGGEGVVVLRKSRVAGIGE
jgi:hypothetical protein